MVVDDHPALVEILRIRLESNGFTVRCAYSGKDLFAGLEEQKPDLILLDMMMPQMDGLEVLRRLKGAPENSSIPIIMLTAMANDWEAAHKLGADYYITKPYTAPQLSNLRLRTPGVSPGVKASEGWEGFAGLYC